MLVVMMAVFFATRNGNSVFIAYVHAFAEAAMIGGLADWFAVTALFRRPLGLPIMHTAIIPSQKERIADSMAEFLRAYFLTPAVVARRLAAVNFAQQLSGHVKAQGQSPSAAQMLLSDFAAQILRALDVKRLGSEVRSGLVTLLKGADLSPLLGRMLQSVIADNRHRRVVDDIIRWAGLTLEDNEETIRDLISERAHTLMRITGLDERLANAVLDGLYRLLAEVIVDPEHPLRLKLDQRLHRLAHDLQNAQELRQRVEDGKLALLSNPALADWWMGVWEDMRLALITKFENGGAELTVLGNNVLGQISAKLESDPRMARHVNRLLRRCVVDVSARYGDEIVGMVSQTVKRWDSDTLVGRLESAVGRDLQFIRINGTLVGGLAGLAIHFVSQNL